MAASHFWTEVDDLFSVDANIPIAEASHDDVQATWELLMGMVEDEFEHHLTHPYELDLLAKRICESSYFQQHQEAVHDVLAQSARQSRSTRQALVSISCCLTAGIKEKSLLRKLQEGTPSFVYSMVHRIWAGHYAAQTADQKKNGSKQWDLGLLPRPKRPKERGSDSSASAAPSRHQRKSTMQISPEKPILQLRSKAVRLLFEVCKVQRLEPKELSEHHSRRQWETLS